MKKQLIFRLCACLLVALYNLPMMSQGVIVYQKDGTKVKYPYEQIDSIVTYNNGEDAEDRPVTTYEAIDLGLSVKWASFNVGATSPEEYGGYYAWGETEEKSSYTIDNYKYFNSSTGGYEYKKLGSNISGTSYDVARVKWGGSWRMPTLSEMQELCSECSWQWTEVNGVKGQKVTGPNGNSIFLPAAGSCEGTEVDGHGSNGLYWSATWIEDDIIGTCWLSFYSRYWSCTNNGCWNGKSVRPVTE
ncbi:MAG: hypothetical protein IJA98_09865 [Bacteroidaceae bacterium]|nr:hypothetical protein [Bacteroidaceae bacterium]